MVSQPPWPGWDHAGLLEYAALQRLLLPRRAGDVEHVGSTAVPGLAAKPILDLQAPVRDLDVADAVSETLLGHDYLYIPTEIDQRPHRRFFVKVVDSHRVAHLHLLLADGDRWRQQLAFRDALRADPALLRAYARLKSNLAVRHRDDREAYSAGKYQFVDDVISRLPR